MKKKKPAYHSLQTDAPQVQTAEAWNVPREDPVLSWQSHTKKKSGQGFLPPAHFVSTQAKQGAYLSHRSAYEICRGCVFLSDS